MGGGCVGGGLVGLGLGLGFDVGGGGGVLVGGGKGVGVHVGQTGLFVGDGALVGVEDATSAIVAVTVDPTNQGVEVGEISSRRGVGVGVLAWQNLLTFDISPAST